MAREVRRSCVVAAYKERAAQYRAKLKGDALAESKMTPEQLSQIQQALITLGFFDGKADGILGPVTRTAIRKYQEANGIPQSDFLSVEQRRALLERGAAGPAVAETPPRSRQQPASAQPAQDTTYATIGWWSISYMNSDGCQAVAGFKGGTVLSLGLIHLDEGKAWIIGITNPDWKGWIKKKKQHTLRLVTTKTWQGPFFTLSGHEGSLYSGDVSIEFMNSTADAKSLEIFDEKNRLLASLDMKDSTNAIKAVVNCARENVREAREAQATPQQKPQQETASSGTGFFVAPNLFMTNKHVVDGCNTIDVRYPGQTLHSATISGQDITNDLALLRTDMSGESVASFRLGPRLGEAVATYGFPYHGILSSSGNFTLGNVTSLAGMEDDTRFLQMSTPIQPGNSGGPLLDMSGAVVGVVVSQLSAITMMLAGDSVPQNVNFAIHAAVATNFLSIKGVKPKTLDTSASVQALSPSDVADMAKQFTVQVICRGASPRLAKGDIPVAVVAHFMEKFGSPQPPPKMGALSGQRAINHSRHLLQSQWRRVNRESTP
jgi:peptidoglycan hydrolase-like protein with peptidoglycan-binding domain